MKNKTVEDVINLWGVDPTHVGVAYVKFITVGPMLYVLTDDNNVKDTFRIEQIHACLRKPGYVNTTLYDSYYCYMFKIHGYKEAYSTYGMCGFKEKYDDLDNLYENRHVHNDRKTYYAA